MYNLFHKWAENYKCYLGRIKNRFVTSHLYSAISGTGSQIKIFSQRRKLSVLILLLSIIGFVVVLALIQEPFQLDKPRTGLHIVLLKNENTLSGTESREISVSAIDQVFIRIEYDQNGNDKLQVSIDFKSDLRNVNLILTPSTNLKPDPNSFWHKQEINYENDGVYFYNISQNFFSETFVGNMFGENRQDINFQLGLNIGYTSAGMTEIPHSITIIFPPDVDIGSVFPEPAERTIYNIQYKYPDFWSDPIDYIFISGSDRSVIFNKQAQLLIYGIIIAILSGIMATVLLDLVKFIETGEV